MEMAFRCQHCEEVIGMYEPMVVIDEAGARSSARLDEQAGAGPPGECYHRDCYVRVYGGDPTR